MTISYKGFMRERIQRHPVTIGKSRLSGIIRWQMAILMNHQMMNFIQKGKIRSRMAAL